MGKPSENEGLPAGKRLQFTMERSTMLLMGKSTISTGPFSIAMLVYQRVTSYMIGLGESRNDRQQSRFIHV